jgi:hypothetical protein
MYVLLLFLIAQVYVLGMLTAFIQLRNYKAKNSNENT